MRIGIDMDGTLADFACIWRHVERQLFGDDDVDADTPDDEAPAQEHGRDRRAGAIEGRRREVWRAIRSVEDFWTCLPPIEEGVVQRLNDLALERKWEVFFLTQRPATAGETVQRQTQRWLVAQGFEQPRAPTVTASPAAAAAALCPDGLIDDAPGTCLAVAAEPCCRPIH